ncbi:MULTISPECIES: alpha/beta hydrolase [Bacillaceae]|uniref:alpha/beta hydrolase n=1 Tax=Bacillaceae TaxID=186817 RepID=UPI000B9B8F74|nr:alpha/beta hydrolase [Bacillus infantis]MCK6206093.1 alpha/beta fold hydrolase [Bacillus infantis]MDW2876562.1 alpha/beta fold hydrolase [Bacillus infantis]OXT16795.1 hypothetical protein B9K06_13980 [Bacillus sp. OG2]
MTISSRGVSYHMQQSSKAGAETIVFAHGLGMDSSIWSRIIPHLTDDFHVLTFDFTGHGSSKKIEGSASWESLLEDFRSIADAEGLSGFHFAGQGMGVHLGIRWAERYPSSLSSFIVFTTSILYPAEYYQSVYNTASNLADQMIPKLISNMDEESCTLIKNSLGKLDFLSYLELHDMLSKTKSFTLFNRMTIPVLLLAAEYDDISPPSLVFLGGEITNRKQRFLIPEASHLIQLDQPALTAEKCISFLSGLSGAAIPRSGNINPFLTELIRYIDKSPLPGPLFPEKKLELKILDEFKLLADQKEIKGKWNQRKAKELLTYLCLFGSASREMLADVFWPELPQSNSQNQLRVSLTHLRKIFQGSGIPDVIKVENNHVSIDAKIELDSLQLDSQLKDALESNDWTRTVQLKEKMIKQVPVKFLPQFKAKWAEEYRNSLNLNFLRLLTKTYKQHLHLREITEALTDMELILKITSDKSKIHQEIKELYEKIGFTAQYNTV